MEPVPVFVWDNECECGNAIIGYVTDEFGNGISGVKVNISTDGGTTWISSGSTDMHGFYYFDMRSVGSYKIGIDSKPENEALDIMVVAGEITTVNFEG
jgi:hypothetical protein